MTRLIIRTRRRPYNIYTGNGTRLVGTTKAHSANLAIDVFMKMNGGYTRQDLSAVEVGRPYLVTIEQATSLTPRDERRPTQARPEHVNGV